MIKKLFTLCLGMMLVAGLSAQDNNKAYRSAESPMGGAKDITVSSSDIQFWCGTGSNQGIVIVSWDDCTPAIAYAWGVRWNGNITAIDMIDSIATHDSRFSYQYGGSLISDVEYSENGTTLASPTNYWCYYLNGNWAQNAYGNQSVANGDVIEMSATCYFSLTTATPATDPNGSTTDAQEATIAASDILYWVGSGSNEVIMAVNWNDPDTCLAWGFRFSTDSVTLQQVMDTIQANDPRFSYVFGWGVEDIIFAENGDTLALSTGAAGYNYWWSNVNGSACQHLYDEEYLHNGDFMKWGDPECGVVLDTMYGYPSEIVWTTTVHPVTVPQGTTPDPVDATIAACDILYWVGSGSNEVVFAVNWNAPDTCLAWGFRFSTDSVTLQQVMDTIQANDPRFQYIAGAWGVDDILFVVGNDTLALSEGAGYNYWWSNLNGTACQYAYDQQYLHNGDFAKWGDPECGIALAYDWGYPSEIVWTTTVHPVSLPEAVTGPFCGAVGTEGCTAVEYSDSRIKGWATGCTVVRGNTDIANPGTLVSYGEETDAVGPCDNNNLNVVSLGDGGMATLTFERPITNGEGFDFAVYENSFNDSFLELAFVEVSSDGENFVRFPATSLTQTNTQVDGYGSLDPTFINNLAGKYRVGWGTPFDLDELRDSANIDINNVRYVRVIDVVGSIDPQYGSLDAFGHLINDPYPTNNYSGGFDLDGVCVMNYAQGQSIDEAALAEMRLYPNPANSQVVCNVTTDGSHQLTLFDMTGRVISQKHFDGNQIVLSTAQLANGVYMIRIDNQVERLVMRH